MQDGKGGDLCLTPIEDLEAKLCDPQLGTGSSGFYIKDLETLLVWSPVRSVH